ncbi:MAG: FGGY family carbohydrate kinase [Leadbetterella sp.]
MRVCLIFDIGKTNKKALLFTTDYKVVWQKSEIFEEILDDDGDHCDDLHALCLWMKRILEEIKGNEAFDLIAVNFSAYGASMVHVDASGHPISPLYNYLKVLPKDIKASFLEKHNPNKDLFLRSSSPDLGMLNSGLQVYWLKYKKPEVYKYLRYSLHFPQYLQFLFTQQPVADYSSVGCHTAIWDFHTNTYLDWLSKENLRPLVNEVQSSDKVFKIENLAFGIGMHDSSAALVPYLKCLKEPFVLISTGTWSISLNPFTDDPLTNKELQKDCLRYLTYEGKPVKASRVFMGNEHNLQTQHLAQYFSVDVDRYKTVKYDVEIIKNLRKKNDQKMPSHADLGDLKQSCFVERSINSFSSYEEAYHQLIMDLVAQQVASIHLILDKKPIKSLIIEGGFANNEVFLRLLNEAFFGLKLYKSKLAQGSALGAAMVIDNFWGARQITEKDLDLELV